ncbi:MAG: hypothetical protein K1060chlam1_01191 [Candidatus Anoxychlamydiales bacterium]|nr:hypothetical protein [Candidatus Anoxychlamydiales bacterium]
MGLQGVLPQISSYFGNSNGIKPLDTNFQLDEDTCISEKEVELLPDLYKEKIKAIFSKVLKMRDVLSEIKKIEAISIEIKVQKGELVYSLNGMSVNNSLRDKKVQQAFEKAVKNIKKYLKNIRSIKDKKVVDLTEKDIAVIKNRPSNIDVIKAEAQTINNKIPKVIRVPFEYFRKFMKTDAEWSIWAVWISDIQRTIIKVLETLSLKFKYLGSVKGWDDWFGYLVGSFGLINGIEDFKDAEKIDDNEGRYDGVHKIIRSIFAIGGGSIDWVSKVIQAASHLVIKLALSIIASSIFLFVTQYAFVRYVYFDIKALHFKKKLNEYLENDKLSFEEKKVGALKFLKDKLMVSKRKSITILKKTRNQNPNLTDEKIQKLFKEEIKKLVQTKVKRFERRVGTNLAALIQRNVKQILNDPTNEFNIEKADRIFEKIKCKNSLTIRENTLFSLAIALQGIEILLFIIIGVTIPALIPGILSTAVFVYLQGYNIYRSYILNVDKQDKKDAEEIDNIGEDQVAKRSPLIEEKAI